MSGPTAEGSRIGARALTVLTAVAPTVVVLGALELTLGAMGKGERAQNVSRGFNPDAAYIVPDPEKPGAFRTQIFEGRRPETKIPAKSERQRVFLFGGSNTQSFKGQHLWLELDERRPDGHPGHEVYNLGRSGYGSSRVAILFEQALELEPDVVVIYSGHNEFIEAGFRTEVEDEWSGAIGTLGDAATNLRTFNALVKWFEPEVEGASLGARTARPEEIRRDYKRFVDQTYDRTLERYEGYAENLADMCRMALDRDIEVVLCTVVGNDLSAPRSSTLPSSTSDADRAEIERLDALAIEALPPFLQLLTDVDPTKRWRGGVWWANSKSPRDVTGLAPIPPLRPYERVIGERTWWHDRSEWGDPIEPTLRAFAKLHAGEFTDDELASMRDAASHLEGVLALCPDHPMASFRLGLVRMCLGEDVERWRSSILDAGRYDRAPQRTSDLSNEHVRRVAREVDGVHLVDLAKLYRERSPDGIVGVELMADECHFHRDYYVELMHDLADPILEITTGD